MGSNQVFSSLYISILTSSISTINYILFKTKDESGLLTYETSLKRLGNYVLTILIIITPGSTVIRISKILINSLFIVLMFLKRQAKTFKKY